VKLVIKIGGTALENKVVLKDCARAIGDLAADGHEVAVVHGGGAPLTRALASMGKQSTFVSGLRVTDAETRDAALMVLSGLVNKNLVAAIGATGHSAIGICGGDGSTFRARKKVSPGCDLGFVGEIVSVDAEWIEAIWGHTGIPVIASLALGFDGEYYNVNADLMAASCAVACAANALIFLTDVPGVKDADGAVMQWLHLEQIPDLVRDSVVAGGMLPKLEACEHALRGGVDRVRILPAQLAAQKLSLFFNEKLECGTEVLVA
jgi:acetylglutamate kinase